MNYPEIVGLEIEPDLEKLYGAVILHNHTKYLPHFEIKTFGMVLHFTHCCEKKTAQMVVRLVVKVGNDRFAVSNRQQKYEKFNLNETYYEEHLGELIMSYERISASIGLSRVISSCSTYVCSLRKGQEQQLSVAYVPITPQFYHLILTSRIICIRDLTYNSRWCRAGR